jgi:hypothetical protein
MFFDRYLYSCGILVVDKNAFWVIWLIGLGGGGWGREGAWL